MAKKYYNTFTDLDGIEHNLREISNEEYLLMSKFAESQNKRAFFEVLDDIIKDTIPNFDNFILANKLYTYIATTVYSIKPTITINDQNRGNLTVSLVSILDNIENQYEKKEFEVSINDVTLVISPPTTYEIDGECIDIDYTKSIKSVKMNNQTLNLSPEQVDTLIQKLPQSTLIEIQCKAKERLSCHVDILRNTVPGLTYKLDVNSPESLLVAFNIIPEQLESFYWRLFASTHYVRLNDATFMNMTPIETAIILKDFQKVQEEAKKDRESISTSAQMTDPIM